MDRKFLEESLKRLATENQIPDSLVPNIIYLMNEHPNLEVYGAKTRLKEGLEKIISTAVKEGKV